MMIRTILGLLAALCATNALAAPGSDIDTLAKKLLERGFTVCDTGKDYRLCRVNGTQADGHAYSLLVLAGHDRETNAIEIFVEPQSAIDSREVSTLYDNLASLVPYGDGMLKDRFPTLASSKAFCDTAPIAVHVKTRCLVIEQVGQGSAFLGGGTEPIDYWSMNWPIPRRK